MAEGIYLATINELTAVADAIRTKGETTDGLVWPDGFVAAIENISGGYKAALPVYTYDGDHSLNDEGEGNWTLTLFAGGVLNFSKLTTPIDVFLVGGGGGGAQPTRTGHGGGGGGGGYTLTNKNMVVDTGINYVAVVGAGGTYNTDGGATSVFSITANGGKSGNNNVGGAGGSGGGTGGYSTSSNSPAGNGGSDGADGVSNVDGYTPGQGQESTTRAFGEDTGTLYGGGGGGGCGMNSSGNVGASSTGGDGGGAGGANVRGGAGRSAGVNTGGGGGGGCAVNGSYSAGVGGTGGSGIIIIRNARG